MSLRCWVQPMIKRLFLFAVWTLAIALGLMFLLILVRSPRLRSLEGELPTRQAVESDRKLSLLAQILPATARDIHYYVRPLGRVIYVNFTISKAEFLHWAAAQGWQFMEIGSSRYLEASPLNAGLLSVDSGFYYEEKRTQNENPEVITSELRVIFDVNKSRCFYRFTGAD
ncbi:MAG: hypothetical protein QME66_13925 [Candidatus Eisenbacteria bacterium]|nr:hypothetical protein [Candidatus Eisenbacteria bacterium]